MRISDWSSDVCSSDLERRNSIGDQRGSRPVTIIVHHLENSRSQRVLWLLEELDLPYEVRRYERDPKTMLAPPALARVHPLGKRSEEHTSELQSLMRISYAVFCLQKKNQSTTSH